MGVDLPKACIKKKMPHKEKGEIVIMKITGQLVDMLLKRDPDKFKGYVLYEKEINVIYVVVLREIDGMLVALLLWYQKFKKYLKSIGFVFNKYDTCVANRVVNEKHHTVIFIFYYILYRQINHKVNDKFLKLLNLD